MLVVFFGSTAQPVTILAPVLFSSIGSLLALIVIDAALGLPAMIGQLLLIGIVVANSILLVDTALRKRRLGVERDDALVAAARQRVRPVLMTAVATIAALTPLAAGLSGEGGIISRSLGAVVIGGLLTSTLLTLVIVPAVSATFDALGNRVGDLLGRRPRSALATADRRDVRRAAEAPVPAEAGRSEVRERSGNGSTTAGGVQGRTRKAPGPRPSGADAPRGDGRDGGGLLRRLRGRSRP